ncbi:MAG: secretin N-terminal domain-containing protein [Phycisphaerae bacterium]|jgi:type II secretory pathway component GspD/PulD (secretin)
MITPRQRWTALALVAVLAVAAAVAQDARRRPRAEGHPTTQPAEPRSERGPRVQVEAARPEHHEPATIQVFRLKHANAEFVANIVGQMQRVMEDRVIASPDGRTNSLVVATQSKQTGQQIRELVEALDVPAEYSSEAEETRCIALNSTPASKMIEYLYKLAPRSSELRCVADDSTNTVWLVGPQALLERLADIVTWMDSRTGNDGGPPRELRVYRFENAVDGRVANTINAAAEMMRLDGNVIFDPASGMLLICGERSATDRLEQITKALDVPPRPDAPPERPRMRRERPAAEEPKSEEP